MDDRPAYQRLPVSRAAIDRTGPLLADRLAAVPASVDTDVLDAMDLLADHRDVHRNPLRRVAALLEDVVAMDNRAADVAERLKRSQRIIEKLARLRSMSLTSMQDIAGCRAVVPSLADVALVRDRLAEQSGVVVLREDDYNTSPRKSGYRAHHLIVSAGGAPVEVQLRTAWQQAWTDRVERLDTDYGVGLKHDRGPEVVRAYLALLAYAESERHVGGRLDPTTEVELVRLEAAALAALQT
jgi:ppGpp synthetase/RelA/SpoT-type nucleotidyltranferase